MDEGHVDQKDFPWESDGYKAPTPAEDIIEGIPYNGKEPNAYLDSLNIGLKGKQQVKGDEVVGG